MTYRWFPFKMDWLLLNEQAVQLVYATSCVQPQISQNSTYSICVCTTIVGQLKAPRCWICGSKRCSFLYLYFQIYQMLCAIDFLFVTALENRTAAYLQRSRAARCFRDARAACALDMQRLTRTEAICSTVHVVAALRHRWSKLKLRVSMVSH